MSGQQQSGKGKGRPKAFGSVRSPQRLPSLRAGILDAIAAAAAAATSPVHRTDLDPEENVMRAKLLVATAAGLAFLALPVLAQTQASPPGGPPSPPRAGDDDDDDRDGMMGPRHHMMGPRHGPRHHRSGLPPSPEAGQLRLSPAIHVRRGDLVLDLECSVRDSVEDCAAAALRLLERLESPPP